MSDTVTDLELCVIVSVAIDRAEHIRALVERNGIVTITVVHKDRHLCVCKHRTVPINSATADGCDRREAIGICHSEHPCTRAAHTKPREINSLLIDRQSLANIVNKREQRLGVAAPIFILRALRSDEDEGIFFSLLTHVLHISVAHSEVKIVASLARTVQKNDERIFLIPVKVLWKILDVVEIIVNVRRPFVLGVHIKIPLIFIFYRRA